MDMVKRGDMMSVEDVVDILAIDLIGVVPDDESIVIATNEGEPLVGSDTQAGKRLLIFVIEWLEKKCQLWNSRQKAF